MKKRSLLLMTVSLLVLFTMLACSLPGLVPTAEPGLGPVTSEPDPVVDPPAGPTPLTVAYVKAGNIWLWTETGGSRQLTFTGDTGNPSVSSDGRVVSFLRGGELWAVDADGAHERVLADRAFLATVLAPGPDGDLAEVYQHVWQPGSHIVYFNTLTVSGIAGYRIPRFDLYRVDGASPSASPVNLQPADMGGVPTFSPDGTVVALVTPTKLSFLAVDGSFYTEALTFPMVLTYSEWYYVPELAWLPDSSGVRMAVPASDPLGDPMQLSTFWNIPVSGAPSVKATYLAVPAFQSFQYVSPNADTVLYMMESGGMAQIHSINSGGADLLYFWYDPGTVGITGWAPDSIHFTFWYPAPVNAGYGSSDTNMALGDSPRVQLVKWVDDTRFFYLNDEELRLGTLGGASSLIDSGVSEYAFVP